MNLHRWKLTLKNYSVSCSELPKGHMKKNMTTALEGLAVLIEAKVHGIHVCKPEGLLIFEL